MQPANLFLLYFYTILKTDNILFSIRLFVNYYTGQKKKILAYKVRAALGYIGGAEFENDLIFFRLALVFEIFYYLGLFIPLVTTFK